MKFFVFLIGFCIGQTVTLTSFSPNGGAVVDGTSVSISAVPADAIICITRWDEYPVCNSLKTGCTNGFQYKSGLLKKTLADEGFQWYAIGCKAGLTDSSYMYTQNYWGSPDKPTPVIFSPIGAPQDQEITLRTSVTGTNSYIICYAEESLPDCSNTTDCDAGTKYMDNAKPKLTANSIGKTWVAVVCTDQYTKSEYSYQTWGEVASPFLIPSGGSYEDNKDVLFRFPPTYVAISSTYFCVGFDKTVPTCKRSDSTCSTGTKVDSATSSLKKIDTHNGKRWAVIACPPPNGNYLQSDITYTNTWDVASKVSLPVFYPDGGFIIGGIIISAVPYDATICYSVKDQPSPKCSATKDACDVGDKYDPTTRLLASVAAENFYQAIACKSGLTDSLVATSSYAFTKDGSVTFNPNGGVVTAGQEIELATKLGGAICYTTDNNYPTCNSAQTGCDSGSLYDSSKKPKITESDYGDYWIAIPCKRQTDYWMSNIWNKLKSPTFDPAIGSVDNGKEISIIADPTDATICYVADGNEDTPDPLCTPDLTVTPDCVSGSKYNPQNKTKKTKDNTLWKAVACRKGSYPSDVVYATYWKNSAPPTFTPSGGSLQNDKTVTIGPSSPTITICYVTSDSPNPPSSLGCSTGSCPTGTIKYNPTTKAVKSSSDNGKYWIAIACESGKEPSVAVATKGKWNNQVIAPMFDPDGGPMLDKNRVSVSSPTLVPYPNDGVICMCLNDCANGPKCKSDGKTCESGFLQYNDKNKPQYSQANHNGKKWKAIACKKNMDPSTITMTTNAWNQVRLPTIFPDGGAILVGTPVQILSTDGATICYGRSSSVTCTITNGKGTCANGDDVSTKRPVITKADVPSNWYAVACKNGLQTSSVKTTKFKWRDPNVMVSPNILPNGGKTAENTPVIISSEVGNVICFTKSASDYPSCNSDNSDCVNGARYDSVNPPLKTEADNGKRWQAIACDSVLGPSTISTTLPWEKYINGAISSGVSIGLLIFSFVSLVMIM